MRPDSIRRRARLAKGRRAQRIPRIVGWFLVGVALCAPAGAEDNTIRLDQQRDAVREQLQARVTALEQTLEQMRAEHAHRLSIVEARLDGLEAALLAGPRRPLESAIEPAEPTPAAERALLEQELARALAEVEKDEAEGAAAETDRRTSTASGRQFIDRARNMNELNPEISVAGDVFGTVADRNGDAEVNRFRLAEFEIAFQAPLDPFSQAKAFVVQENGEFEVEEAYIDWNALPGGLGLRVGQMRNDWGKLNRWHQHGLPQADRPLVHQAFFGEEGLKGLGMSLSLVSGGFLGDYSELLVQIVNDENNVAFSGRSFDDPVFVFHETNYWDLGRATYLELGFSAATGVNDDLGEFRTTVYGVDWNVAWRPPERSTYRGFEWRGELLYNRRGGATGKLPSWGGYTYGTYKLDQRWLVGARLDWTELPEESGESLWGVAPYVEWWQSEWARLRLQYSRNSRRLEEDKKEHRFFLQVTWALGPHKHEKY